MSVKPTLCAYCGKPILRNKGAKGRPPKVHAACLKEFRAARERERRRERDHRVGTPERAENSARAWEAILLAKDRAFARSRLQAADLMGAPFGRDGEPEDHDSRVHIRGKHKPAITGSVLRNGVQDEVTMGWENGRLVPVQIDEHNEIVPARFWTPLVRKAAAAIQSESAYVSRAFLYIWQVDGRSAAHRHLMELIEDGPLAAEMDAEAAREKAPLWAQEPISGARKRRR